MFDEQKAEQFKNMVNNLANFLSANKPSAARVALWYEACCHIPSHVLEYIFKMLPDQLAAFPKNLPMAIKEQWHCWQNNNSDQIAPAENIQCHARGCRNGVITAKTPVTDYEFGSFPYRVVCLCDKCARRRHLSFGDEKHYTNADDLEAKGYEIVSENRGGPDEPGSWDSQPIEAYQDNDLYVV